MKVKILKSSDFKHNTRAPCDKHHFVYKTHMGNALDLQTFCSLIFLCRNMESQI